jgi:hypothetical protein
MTPLFAGVTRMKYYRFVPYNVAAAAVWSVVYSLIGYVFGQYWTELLAVAKSFGYGVVGLVSWSSSPTSCAGTSTGRGSSRPHSQAQMPRASKLPFPLIFRQSRPYTKRRK